MKIRKLVSIVLAVTMLYACLELTSLANSTTIKVEAENYVSNNGVGTCTKAGYAGASGDAFIYLSSGAIADYKVTVPVSGKYSVKAHIASDAEQYTNVRVNGTGYTIFGKQVITGGGLIPSSAIDFEYAQVSLIAGQENTIQFYNGGSSLFYFDCFTLERIGDIEIKIEAESASSSSGNWVVSSDYSTQTSGKKAVYFYNGGTGTFKVTVPIDGKYSIKAHVSSAADQWTWVTVDGQNGSQCGTGLITGTSINPSNSIDKEYMVVDLLTSKEHTIEFYNGGGNFLFFDYFTLVRVGAADPVTVKLIAANGTFTSEGGTSIQNGNLSFQPMDSVTWTTNIPYNGKYDFTVSKASISGVIMNLYIDDTLIKQSSWLQPEASAWSGIQNAEHSIVTGVDLTEGSHTIKVELPQTDSIGNSNGACVFTYLLLERQGEGNEEVKDPTIIDMLAEGDTTITVDTSEAFGGEILYGAVYYNGKLIDLYVQTATGSTNTMNIKGITAGTEEEKAKYKFRLFLWSDMTPLTEPSYTINAKTIVYVSNNGSDSNDGSESNPVATIQKAQILAQAASVNKTCDVIVNIGAGEYTLTSPLTYTASDNQTNGGTVTYEGAADGGTVLNGGLKVTGWQQSNITGVYMADVNVTDLRQLWIDGNKASRASSGLFTGTGFYDDTSDSTYTDDGITFSKTVITNDLSNETGLELVWNRAWTRQRFKVNKIVDINSSTAAFVPERFGYARSVLNYYNTPSYSNSFTIENALYYLDSEGEFYFDKTNKKLYYYPRNNENLQTAQCYVGVSEGLISVSGTKENNVNNLTFKNITLKYGTWLSPNSTGAYFGQADKMLTADIVNSIYGGDRVDAQIEVSYGNNINFSNVNVAHVGSAAYSFTEGVSRSSIKNSSITDTAAGGIMIGTWEPADDKCTDISISGNTISDIAHEYGGQCAVTAYYVKNTDVSNNTISDTAYSAISFGWGWAMPSVADCTGNTITANKISNYMNELNDGAAIYTLGRTASLDVSRNYIIDDILRSNNVLAHALYADEGTTNAVFENNVIQNSNQWIYARDNANISGVKVKNNYTNVTTVKNANTTDTAVAEFTGTVNCSNGFPSAAQTIMNAAGAAE